MINKFYREFKIRDYMGEENIIRNKKTIDCSLGTNPFIKSGYIDPKYSDLKKKIIEVVGKDMGVIINSSNISFGSWHNGDNKKLMYIPH